MATNASSTRRSFIHAAVGGGLAAAAVPVTALALTEPAVTDPAHPDAALFVLELELLAVQAEAQRLSDIGLEIDNRISAALPPRPERPGPEEMHEMFRTITHGEYLRLDSDHPLVRWVHETEPAYDQALSAWQEERDRLDLAYGHTEAQDAVDAAYSQAWEIGETIWETPATTLAGLMVKVRTFSHLDFPSTDGSEPFESVAADIEAMADKAA